MSLGVYRSAHDLSIGIDVLVRAEPRFLQVVEAHGLPALRPMPEGLSGLLMLVVEQLISLSAAKAIWQRLENALGDFNPETLLQHSELQLQQLGLTKTKAQTFLGLAKATQNRDLVLSEFSALPNDSITQKLCAHRGIGPWTAQVYLLCALGRADAWPAGDLALRVAMQDLLALADRPSDKEMQHLSASWQPHRTAAALLLWSHYRGMKSIQQVRS